MAEKSLVDRMLELGLGIAAYSEEKVADFLKEVTAKGEAKKENITKIKKELRKKSENFRKELAGRIKKEVEVGLKRMNLATARDLAGLKKRLDDLETKLGK